jgi:hypothetical protein
MIAGITYTISSVVWEYNTAKFSNLPADETDFEDAVRDAWNGQRKGIRPLYLAVSRTGLYLSMIYLGPVEQRDPRSGPCRRGIPCRRGMLSAAPNIAVVSTTVGWLTMHRGRVGLRSKSPDAVSAVAGGRKWRVSALWFLLAWVG